MIKYWSSQVDFSDALVVRIVPFVNEIMHLVLH